MLLFLFLTVVLHSGGIVGAFLHGGTCSELVHSISSDYCSFPQELPLLSISVNCTSGQVVINRTDSIPAELVDKPIVDLVLEYNATNRTSGESEVVLVGRNAYETILDFGVPSIDFHDDFSHYEIKACLAFQTYPCWILNKQDVSCNFSSISLPSHSSSSSSHTYSTSTLPSSIQSLHNPTRSITIATSSTLFHTTTTTSVPSNAQAAAASISSAIIITLCVLLMAVGVALSVTLTLFVQLLCYYKLRATHGRPSNVVMDEKVTVAIVRQEEGNGKDDFMKQLYTY